MVFFEMNFDMVGGIITLLSIHDLVLTQGEL